jgi:hypothetical protein
VVAQSSIGAGNHHKIFPVYGLKVHKYRYAPERTPKHSVVLFTAAAFLPHPWRILVPDASPALASARARRVRQMQGSTPVIARMRTGMPRAHCAYQRTAAYGAATGMRQLAVST